MKKILFILSFAFCLTINAQIITTVAGNGTAGYSGDGGQATLAELSFPTRVIFDGVGNMFIAEANNNCIRKVNTLGVITTIAGNRLAGFSGDGGQASNAQLAYPIGLAFDLVGNLYIADALNERIRKINTFGIITTVAGSGNYGFSGDGSQATAAELNVPSGIAFDAAGNFYIADAGNMCIRKVNTSGIISTVVGNGTQGFSGDGGQASNSQLNQPTAVTVDNSGNIFIADNNNNRIRKVNTLGIINTVVGNGTQGYSGDGGQATDAELYAPNELTFDGGGNMYIVDNGNYRLRLVNSLGIITTIAGNGTFGYNGDGGLATAAELSEIHGVCLDASQNIYITDFNNNRIRRINNSIMGISQYSNLSSQISIYPNPSSGIFTIETNTTTKQTIQVYDVNGRIVLTQTVNGKATIDMSNLPAGVYNINLADNEGVVNKRIVIAR